MNVTTEPGKPGYLAVFQANLGDGRQISLQFNFALGATAVDWAKELDVLGDVVDRQIARAQLPRERNVLTVQENTAETIEGDIEKMSATISAAENARDPERRNQAPVAQHVSNRDAQKQSLAKIRREIEAQKKLIADLEKKAA